jgi:hypothetical protein
MFLVLGTPVFLERQLGYHFEFAFAGDYADISPRAKLYLYK